MFYLTKDICLLLGVTNPPPYPISGYFHGYIDDVRIYNRSLTNSEINQLIAREVNIDIFPQNALNILNLDRGGQIAVAVLSTNTFDALQVNDTTFTFGPSEAYIADLKVKDIDKDDDLDLILYFNVSDIGISCADSSATLLGETYDGVSIIGTDLITVKSCK